MVEIQRSRRPTERQVITRRWTALATVLLGAAAVIWVAAQIAGAIEHDQRVKAHEAAQTKALKTLFN